MRMSKLLLPLVLLIGAIHAPAFAQAVPDVKLPPSPPGQAAAQVGGTWSKGQDGGPQYTGGKWITVDYSRPLLRGRPNIFGSGAEYGKTVSGGGPVWRAGANATTRLTTQVPLVIAGKNVAPGVYSVLVELREGAWTLILSSQPVQDKFDPNDKVKLSGSTNYDPKFDVLRAPMTVTSNAQQTIEQFTISFIAVSERALTLRMEWDQTVATAAITLGT
ncbi:MAG: DUF2911 domain-containing protein [Luteitalea sp.]